MAVLRYIVTVAEVTIVIVHHDIKPRRTDRTSAAGASGPRGEIASRGVSVPSTSSA